jgi:hypothetical protein
MNSGGKDVKNLQIILFILFRVADPHLFNADKDPDPAFHWNAAPTFRSNADPDPAPYQSAANLRPLVYIPSRVPF